MSTALETIKNLRPHMLRKIHITVLQIFKVKSHFSLIVGFMLTCNTLLLDGVSAYKNTSGRLGEHEMLLTAFFDRQYLYVTWP